LLSRWWALVPLASIALVVWAINTQSETASGLTWLALIAIPPLAAAALGWTMHGGRPWLAALVVPLFLLAWFSRHSLVGEGSATLLTGLSCVTLGVLLVSVAPNPWLKVGIVLMAASDAYLIGVQTLQPANDVLNAAAPPAQLPQLQRALFGQALIGYGDLFIAGVFGALLAAEGRRQGRTALLLYGVALTFDVLFIWLDTLPATVPVALTLIATEAWQWRVRRRERARGSGVGARDPAAGLDPVAGEGHSRAHAREA
jgi:hypothetical protein